MLYINTTDHEKFITICNNLIANSIDNSDLKNADEKNKQLKNDLNKLQQLAVNYKNTFSQLPKLSEEYYFLQRKVRINIRKLQLKQKTNLKNKLGKD